DGAVDRRMPEPASEVVAHSVRRWVLVTAFGGEPPELDLKSRERVQAPHLVSSDVVVEELFRVTGVRIRGECDESPRGIPLEQAVQKRRGGDHLLRPTRVPNKAYARVSSERGFKMCVTQRLQAALGCLRCGPGL